MISIQFTRFLHIVQGQYYKFGNNKLMSSLRNKNKERFRTILREPFNESPNYSYRSNYPIHSPPAQTQPTSPRQGQQPSVQIIKNLEKHIDFIQKRLMESESQKQNLERANEALKQQLQQKEAVISSQLLQIKSNKQSLQIVIQQYESLKVDVDNYKLQQKIDKLNQQINQDKEVENQKELQFATKKNNRFSSAFLPSPFGSPKNYSKQSSQIFEGIMKDETCQSSYYLKDPFEQSLWSEWKKLKKQKTRREKDMAGQTNRIGELQNDLLTQRRQFQKVKLQFHTTQQKYILEISNLKAKINSYAKDKQLFNNKSMIVEEKTREQSHSIKSSAASFPHVFQKTNHNLYINTSAIGLTIQGNKKQEKGIQTNENIQDQSHSKIEILSAQIKEMQLEMMNKQHQWKNLFQQSLNSYKLELKDASDMMDLYKCRIEHLSKIASDRQVEKNHTKRVKQTSNHKVTRQIGVSCSNNLENICQYKQQSEKVRELVQLSQEQKKTIVILQSINQQLQSKLKNKQTKQRTDKLSLVSKTRQEQMSEREENSKITWQSCNKLKKQLSVSQKQHLNLVQNTEKKMAQSLHFQNSFQDILSKYEFLKSETHQEINHLKEQLGQKKQLIYSLSTQLELKNIQLAVEQEQLNSLRSSINKSQNQIAVSHSKIKVDI